MSSKVECSPLDDQISEKLFNMFPRKNCFIEVNPGHVIMPRKYQDISDEIINTDVRPDDVWMISYPRTGKHTMMTHFTGEATTVFFYESNEWYKIFHKTYIFIARNSLHSERLSLLHFLPTFVALKTYRLT